MKITYPQYARKIRDVLIVYDSGTLTVTIGSRRFGNMKHVIKSFRTLGNSYENCEDFTEISHWLKGTHHISLRGYDRTRPIFSIPYVVTFMFIKRLFEVEETCKPKQAALQKIRNEVLQ